MTTTSPKQAPRVEPWERQTGETAKAYHAFCHWRDLPADQRSGGKAFTAHQTGCLGKPGVDAVLRPNLQWKTWKRRWDWEGRADAHDRRNAEVDRLGRLQAISAMNERHAAIAAAFQGKVIDRLNSTNPVTLTPMQMAKWFEVATLVERRARGAATDIVKHLGQPPSRDLAKLSDRELDELERLLEKANVADLDGPDEPERVH